jgi:hypothetical protein
VCIQVELKQLVIFAALVEAPIIGEDLAHVGSAYFDARAPQGLAHATWVDRQKCVVGDAPVRNATVDFGSGRRCHRYREQGRNG